MSPAIASLLRGRDLAGLPGPSPQRRGGEIGRLALRHMAAGWNEAEISMRDRGGNLARAVGRHDAVLFAGEDQSQRRNGGERSAVVGPSSRRRLLFREPRSEEHTSELQSLMRISYAIFCLKKTKFLSETTVQE